jgi:hypothetical protein
MRELTEMALHPALKGFAQNAARRWFERNSNNTQSLTDPTLEIKRLANRLKFCS